jgi:hypothetical protein
MRSLARSLVRSLARSLALAAAPWCVPLVASAQSGSCVNADSPPLAAAPGYGVHVLSAFARGEDITVLGWPIYQSERDGKGGYRVLDSLFAGVIVRAGAPARKVPLPMPGRPFEEPWLVDVSERGARFLFVVSVPRRVPVVDRDSAEIWMGTLDGTRWTDLEHIVTIGGNTPLHSQSIPAAFVEGDSVSFYFGENFPETVFDGISRLVSRRGRWEIVRGDTTVWNWVDYVDLARHRDTLWLATVGMSRAAHRAGDWLTANSVYVTRWLGSGWERPVRLADGTGRFLLEPRLISTDEGLYLAWRETEAGGRSIHWRGLTAGTDTTIRRRQVVSRLTAGFGAWRDVITFSEDDHIGVIARPVAGGLLELARVRAAERLPPVIVSGPRGPIAVTITPTAEDPDVDVVHVFDLSCALGPARPDPRRR